MTELLANLNPAQAEAVSYAGGPLLVFAGAGSGKTRVITQRIAYSVLSRHVEPTAIVALTFTNKAAQEMVRRVSELLGIERLPMTVGTFHSTCARWLRIYGPRFGLSGNFAIYDADDQRALIRKILRDMQLDDDELTPASVAARIERAKNECLGPKEVRSDALLGERFQPIYAQYEERLQKANALDFGDLLSRTVQLLEKNETARQFFHQRFRMFLVDEYQDTNHAQYRLLHALIAGDRPDVCVVGDDDQSIYRFRGADVGNILAFRRDFPTAHVVKLEENYRSSQSILDVANAVIRHNQKREPKTLLAMRSPGQKPKLVIHGSERGEAEWLALALEGRRRAGKPLSQAAVLLRQNAQSRILEEVLTRNRIPFVLVGGQRFYERAEVKDALAFLRLLVHQESDIDLLRVINVPPRGIGEKTVERLATFANDEALSLVQVVCGSETLLRDAGLNTGAAQKVAEFGALIRRWTGLVPVTSPRLLVKHILEESGLLQALRERKTVEAESRTKNLEELLSAIQEWSLNRPEGTIADYLEELALLTDLDRVDATRERVLVMTLHAAKGLEFDVVYMLGLEDGIFPSLRRDGDGDLEEERRLFYVGVTRAMNELWLSGCRSRMIYGQTQEMAPSRYLSEIPATLLGAPVVAGPGVTSPSAFSSEYRRYPSPSRDEPIFSQGQGRRPTVGQRVHHKTFGAGQVVSTVYEGDRVKLVVDFATVGRKTVLAQYLEAGN